MEPIIVLKDLRKIYNAPSGQIPVLNGIDLSILPGEMEIGRAHV